MSYLLYPRRNRMATAPVGTAFGYTMPVNSRVNAVVFSLPTLAPSSSVLSPAPTNDNVANTVFGLPSAVISSAIYLLLGTVTITIATPGVVTFTAHGLPNGKEVKFTTTGSLPTGIVSGTIYYVVNTAANTFQISATAGGAAINTTGSQSGTHTCRYLS